MSQLFHMIPPVSIITELGEKRRKKSVKGVDIVEVTLKTMLQKLCPNEGMGYLKEGLNQLKKKGWVFFQENLDQLIENMPFQFYGYMFPNKKSKVNAFPIHIKHFQFFDKQEDQLIFLQEHFERYYKRQVNKEDMEDYDFERPFVGRDFLWFYRHEN
jgi:hypothetical protein